MHHLQDKVPVHGGAVDIFQFNRRARRRIRPANMPTHKAAHIVRCSQFFHQWHLTPDVDNPMGDPPCRLIHSPLLTFMAYRALVLGGALSEWPLSTAHTHAAS